MEKLTIPPQAIQTLFGVKEKGLRFLEKAAGVELVVRGDQIHIDGPTDAVASVKNLLETAAKMIGEGVPFHEGDLKVAYRILSKHPEADLKDIFNGGRLQTSDTKVITPKSLNQSIYIRSILEQDAVFGIGPAGTGKTYLATAAACSAWRQKEVKRIILTRPAIEAGEKLGFLPGDLVAKVDPFLRPIYDALYDLMGPELVGELIDDGTIEIAPLAFMRGRNLNNSFIILDEAQNTTIAQMKMLLTRMGTGSKAVINGDITQIDLPNQRMSGLVHAMKVLTDVKGLEFVFFEQGDVVRHPLVERIIRAYDKAEQQEKT